MADSYHCDILLRNIFKNYPRGTLLELNNKDGSYKEHTHNGLPLPRTIRCDNDGDVAPLSEVECSLLDAIYIAADRYDAYSTPGKMEWGRSLKVGDTVLARLSEHSASGQQHQYTTAIIRWCGRMNYRYQFGVEITVCLYT